MTERELSIDRLISPYQMYVTLEQIISTGNGRLCRWISGTTASHVLRPFEKPVTDHEFWTKLLSGQLSESDYDKLVTAMNESFVATA